MSDQRPRGTPPPPSPDKLPAGELLWRSALWALAVAVGCGVLYGLAALVGAALGGPAAGTVAVSRRALVLAAVAFPVALHLRLVWRSRAYANRSFTWLGFLATFFGLAMLCVFFATLGEQTLRWFEVMPELIEGQNKQHQADIASARAYVETRVKAVEEELRGDLERIDLRTKDLLAEAKTAAERAKVEAEAAAEKARVEKNYRTRLIPNRTKEFEKTVSEKVREAESKIRTDVSPAALAWHFVFSYPEAEVGSAGIYPALMGSIWLGLITLVVAVPVGVGAALYLEEYRGRGRLGNLIQININNLAGVPSVVYGILGGFVFVALFRQLGHIDPRIESRNLLGGGLTLALLTLPIVIVSAQEAIRAVPSSLREGGYALGATQWQVIWHQVLPVARPGILTGTILSLSRAIGEAAPLVMFGAQMYVSQEPTLFSRFTAMPMQIFGWAEEPPVPLPSGGTVPGWQLNAAVASLVLVLVLLTLNGFAIYFRNRAQKRMRY